MFLLRLIQLIKSALNRAEVHFFNFERVVRRRAQGNTNFFFIQIGANDGITVDPIREFILTYNWKGILVEPQKKYFDQLLLNYKSQSGLHFENVAISNQDEEKELFTVKEGKDFEDWHGLIATFKPNVHFSEDNTQVISQKVKCVTLDSLVKKYNVPKINLLQVDTEGFDYEIIKTINFDVIKPDLIHYEHRHLTFEEQFKAKVLLKANGYSVIEEKGDTTAIRRD